MGSLILGDGTKHTIEQQKPEVKVQGDDVYIDGVPFSLPQHKRVVVVLGNAMGISTTTAEIVIVIGNVGKIGLTSGNVIVHGDVYGNTTVNVGSVTVQENDG